VALLAVVTTALWGLVLEDLLPLTASTAGWSWTRWWLAIAALAILSALVLLRARITIGYGTLYYVRYLATGMRDWRQDDLANTQKGFEDLRVVTRSFSLNPGAPTIDLVQDVAAIERDLQSEMNDDRVDTGFSLAPNLLLPAAIAIGHSLYWWQGMHLVELFDGGASLDWAAPPTWPAVAPEPGGAQPRTVWQDKDKKGAVLVRVRLTSGPGDNLPCQAPRVLDLFVPDPQGRAQDVTVIGTDGPSGTADSSTVMLPAPIAATATAKAVREALHEADHQLVVLAARLPKTIAVALGWLLANGELADPRNDPGCGHIQCKRPACLQPWQHLVVPVYDQASRRYVLARVHPDQPTLDDMLSALNWGSPQTSAAPQGNS
jgi:hypothetical protein